MGERGPSVHVAGAAEAALPRLAVLRGDPPGLLDGTTLREARGEHRRVPLGRERPIWVDLARLLEPLAVGIPAEHRYNGGAVALRLLQALVHPRDCVEHLPLARLEVSLLPLHDTHLLREDAGDLRAEPGHLRLDRAKGRVL